MNFHETKKLIIGITAAALFFAAGVTAAMAEEESPSADASVGFYSQYIWRGFELSKDSIVIQPSLSVGYKGFAANLWANLDTDLYGTDIQIFTAQTPISGTRPTLRFLMTALMKNWAMVWAGYTMPLTVQMIPRNGTEP
jgi:hypothetical protein